MSLWRAQAVRQHLRAPRRRGAVGRAEKPSALARVDAAEEHPGLGAPRHHGKLVHRRHQKRRQLPVHLLVDKHERQALLGVALGALPEVARAEVAAEHLHVGRRALRRDERRGVGRELEAAPGAVREGQRRRRRLAVALLLPGGDALAHFGERVGGGGAAHPQPHAEAHVPEARGVGAAQRLQRAHQRRCALKLVEREEPQGVAQDHRHPVAAVGARSPAQTTQHQREGDHPEVGLGLAATRREEDELYPLAVDVRRVVEARHVEQQKGELEEPPARRRVLVALGVATAGLERHRAVGQHEGREEVVAGREQLDALRHAGVGACGVVEQDVARLAASVAVEGHRAPRVDPRAVGVDQRPEQRSERSPVGHVGQGIHLRRHRGEVVAHHGPHLGARNPHGAGPHHSRPLVQRFGGDAVPDGPLHAVAKLEVGDAVVGVVGDFVAAVGARDEALRVAQFERHLEDEGHVATTGLGDGPTVVDDEERQRPRARREPRRVGSDETSFEPQPVGARNLLALCEPCGVEGDAQFHRASQDALPLLRGPGAPLGRLLGGAWQVLRVVERHLHRIALARREQHRHADGGRQELRHLGFGRGLALLVVVAVAARGEVLVVGRVARGAVARGGQKARKVEARRR